MEWRSLDKWQGLINNDFLAEATIILVRANVIRDTLEVISNLGMKSCDLSKLFIISLCFILTSVLKIECKAM